MSLKISENVNLAEYTSWLIGGNADHFCLPTTVEELQEAVQTATANNWPITIFSGGSNVLIADKGIRGLTICLRRFSKIETDMRDGKLYFEALSGTGKSELLKLFLKNQMGPALFMAGLPGDVGGGVVMNAGVAEMFHPREFMELVDWIEVMRPTGEIVRILKSDLKISYRHCDGWQPGIVVKAGMSWVLDKDPDVISKVRDANKIRLSKQPLDMPSCGSVFRNPPGHKAAQLIDQAGLKGLQIGGAQVSMKHANFIVNLGDAKAQDVLDLINHIQKTIHHKNGVDLVPEVVRLGEF